MTFITILAKTVRDKEKDGWKAGWIGPTLIGHLQCPISRFRARLPKFTHFGT
jgi:hypothetical protein